MKKILLTLALMAASFGAFAQEDPLWLRKNSISPDGSQIAFSYKGNIYTVSAKGGDARQITSNPAYESDPLWTRDGKKIVFVSNREKSKEIYVVDAKGGIPQRLTEHPASKTPLLVLEDGSVLFLAAIQQDADYAGFPGEQQLYSVNVAGGRTRQVTSLPIASLSINADGVVLYEDIKGYEDPFRKHHTSSVTRDIWSYTPAAVAKKDKDAAARFTINPEGTFKKLTTFKGEDRNPVFAADGDTFYYLSEQDGTSNIWKSSLSAPEQSKQLTFMKNHPVRYVSISDNGVMSFSWNGELYTLEEGKSPVKVAMKIVTDQLERLEQDKTAASGLNSVAVSPDGKEIAVVIRGDVYVTSVEYSTTRRITDTPQQERDVCFSKDGREIYYSSERNGHWGIYKTSLTEKSDKCFTYALAMEEELVTEKGETCFQPQVSPDGKSLAFLKDRTSIVVKNIANGKEKVVLDKTVNYSYTDGDQSFEWSPDSRYIMCNYQKDGGWNNEDVAVIDVETGEQINLTQSGYSDSNFRWAMKGKAMTWCSDRAGFRSHGSWGSESDVFIMFFDGKTMQEFLMDEEDKLIAKMTQTPKEKKAEEKKEEKAKKDSVKKEEPKVEKLKLDFEGRRDRIMRLTPFSTRLGDYYLTQDGSKLFFQQPLEKTTDLCVLDLSDRSVRVIAKNVYGSIIPSADESSLFILSRSGISKVSTASGSRTPIIINGQQTYRPAEEREYIFNHAWKQVKEKFYDPEIHGIDWEMYRDAYARFLPHIDNNFDFQELLSEMLGELNGSHTGARYFYRSGKGFYSLGVLFDLDHEGDGLRIKEVLKGGTLYIADPEIKEGDLINSVNGHAIKAGEDWFHLFQSAPGQSRMVLNIKKHGKKAEDLYVQPGYSDMLLLYKRWVSKRAEKVAELSNGRVGYVHVQGMDSESFRTVYSDLLGKYRNCEAVIVDTRHNGGGWLHDDLATLLSGKEYIRYQPRGQYAGSDPYSKWTKPSCVLIGEDNYSDASGFPYVYKTLGIGKLIGAPVPGTMTAVWWETQVDPTLVFGIPQVGSWGMKEGRYLENYQIEPDIEVYNDPASELRGEDKQLEAAVKHMLEVIDAEK